jgi:hypothetical protein
MVPAAAVAMLPFTRIGTLPPRSSGQARSNIGIKVKII